MSWSLPCKVLVHYGLANTAEEADEPAAEEVPPHKIHESKENKIHESKRNIMNLKA